jgi:hypothetical protein
MLPDLLKNNFNKLQTLKFILVCPKILPSCQITSGLRELIREEGEVMPAPL